MDILLCRKNYEIVDKYLNKYLLELDGKLVKCDKCKDNLQKNIFHNIKDAVVEERIGGLIDMVMNNKL